MSDSELSKGLNCPRCGGVILIPDGQVIVRCQACDFRSIVRGDMGVRRYQVPIRIRREQALQALQNFFNNFAIAFDAKSKSQVSEVFIAHLPFWTLWGRALGWAFGEKEVGDSKNRHYEPREVKIMQEMVWTGAACDVGEFGVDQVQLTNQPLEPFNGDALHANGMVFEPVGSLSEARQTAETDFDNRMRSATGLDRVSQLFTRFVNQRFGLVYYPLWVVRYLYRGRAFQVVVDGFTGKVLYGKAPGNVIYRAAVLVGGMALGAFLTLDVPSFLLATLNSSSKNDNGAVAFMIFSFVGGLALLLIAYNAYRYGEHYQYGGTRQQDKAFDVGGLFKTVTSVFQFRRQEHPAMSTPALLPMQCIKCQSPIPANVDEVAWVCATCGQPMLLDETQPTGLAALPVHYDGSLRSGQTGRPFWVAQGAVTVQRSTYRGDENRQAQEFWQKPHMFFMPAFACSLDEFVSLGMKLLRQPVVPQQGQPAPFLPVTLSRGDTRPMAEFIIMGIEAERKDMIKSVNIQLNLASPVLWILP